MTQAEREKPVSPMKKAEQLIPIHWFESPIVFYVGSGILASGMQELYGKWGVQDWRLNLFSAGVFISGVLLDRYSTAKAFRRAEGLKKLGVTPSGGEANVIVSSINSEREFLQSKRVKAIDILGTVAASVSPGLGLPFTLSKSWAALNNFRWVERFDIAISTAKRNRRKSLAKS